MLHQNTKNNSNNETETIAVKGTMPRRYETSNPFSAGNNLITDQNQKNEEEMAEMTEKIAVEWELKTESTRNRNKKRLE